jgi:hypothetical protein
VYPVFLHNNFNTIFPHTLSRMCGSRVIHTLSRRYKGTLYKLGIDVVVQLRLSVQITGFFLLMITLAVSSSPFYEACSNPSKPISLFNSVRAISALPNSLSYKTDGRAGITFVVTRKISFACWRRLAEKSGVLVGKCLPAMVRAGESLLPSVLDEHTNCDLSGIRFGRHPRHYR